MSLRFSRYQLFAALLLLLALWAILIWRMVSSRM